ncbi:MAG: Sua5/YciO/YrdC/YwlC family protein [Pseudomonadota bacterium]|nr:Sua5/YciO/YrdC/YwlC family protein [Pseudomonadota bacterium]
MPDNRQHCPPQTDRLNPSAHREQSADDIWLETCHAHQPPQAHTGLSASAVIEQALQTLMAGGIVALPGNGGFQLLCDARNPQAIARLRQRKRSPARPFAVMLADSAAAPHWVQTTGNGRDWLQRPAAPIVLQTLSPDVAADIAAQLAPGLNTLGIMLPPTPLHRQLFCAAAQLSATALALAVTSGNLAAAPLVSADEHARRYLAGIADVLLMPQRDIRERGDDSVVDARNPGHTLIQRIGWGLAPQSFDIPSLSGLHSLPSVLATGGYHNNAVARNSGQRLFLSQQIGDLNNPQHCRQQQLTAAALNRRLQTPPQLIACDEHSEDYAHRLAEQHAAELQLPLHDIPHHVAQLAAVLAEQPRLDPILGLTLNGSGNSHDGKSGGSELVMMSPPEYFVIGAFSRIALPGGDKAAREPWRMALSLLTGYGNEEQRQRWLSLGYGADAESVAAVLQQLEYEPDTPVTTSASRWFDAVAGLLGLCPQQSYDGEACLRLEALAEQAAETLPPAGQQQNLCQTEREGDDGGVTLRLTLLVQRIIEGCLNGEDPARLAWLWHQQLAMGIAAWVKRIARDYRLNSVTMSGNTLQNALLRRLLRYYLAQHDMQLVLPQHTPLNDGGLAAGQVAWTLFSQTDRQY